MTGINICKIKSGTKLLVQTINSLYELKILEKNKITIKGGNYILDTCAAILKGCLSSDDKLLENCIEQNKRMKIVLQGRTLLTSNVINVIVQGDNWEYSMWD
jgi:hypothetical protein